jgi:hypothetical protein
VRRGLPFRVCILLFTPIFNKLTTLGAGDAFMNVNSPTPIVKVGSAGDIGVAHISDMRFSVAEILPGAIIMQWNMAGNTQGDVGMWNSQVTIGGTVETTVKNDCTDQDTSNCMAAFLAVHLTSTSSAYLQNIWVWTADHNLDGGSGYTVISTGRGVLVEATKATWLVGIGAEHNWLYNINFNNAQNVYTGLMQTETPYMQGDGAVKLAPAPCKLRPSLLLSHFTDFGFFQGPHNPNMETQTSPGVAAMMADAALLWDRTSMEAATSSSTTRPRGHSSTASGMATTARGATATAKLTCSVSAVTQATFIGMA